MNPPAPDAVTPPETAVDQGVAWHFGDPFAEQRAAVRSAVVVDRSNREVIEVTGTDRLTWLHSLTTQHLTELADGSTTEGLILNPQGRVEHHFGITGLDGRVILDTEPATAGALLAYLRRMVFWSAVEPAPVTEGFGLFSVLGPDTPRVLGALGLPVPGPGRVVAAAGGFVRGTDRPRPDTVDLLLPRADLSDWWSRLRAAGAAAAGSLAWEALRVESLTPRAGVDTDEKTIPNEVGWIGRAVHMNKGCYRGQETVARVHNLGRPPRHLVLLHLDGVDDDLPEPGTPVTADGRTVGRLGTAVRHHELGGVALALVKRSVSADTRLTVGESAAAVDPDSVREETGPRSGREAVARLRAGR